MKKNKVLIICICIIGLIIMLGSYFIIIPLIQEGRNQNKMRSEFRLMEKAEKFANTGEYRKSIDQYKSIINETKDNPRLIKRAHNNLAWIYATCPDDLCRDGNKAIEHAKLADTEFWQDLDTLAAAYAEAGQFDDAVKTISRAITKAPENAFTRLEERKMLYSKNKPYRE